MIPDEPLPDERILVSYVECPNGLTCMVYVKDMPEPLIVRPGQQIEFSLFVSGDGQLGIPGPLR